MGSGERGRTSVRTLLFGTSYVDTEDRRWLVDKWIRTTHRLNANCDILIVDSASPLPIDDLGLCSILQLGDNIGHLGSTGKDGWGRAFTAGLQRAADGLYDYVGLVDTDILFAFPATPIVAFMAENSINYATVRGDPYPWMEGGIVFMNVKWMRDTAFIAKYGWERMTSTEFPEYRLMDIAGNELYDLCLEGRRNDDGAITPENAHTVEWITHANRGVYEAFLKAQGMRDLLV